MARVSSIVSLLGVWLAVVAGPGRAYAQQYDVVLRGGTVVDGSGAPRFRADVALQGDRIVRVARDGIAAGSGRVEFDVTGLVVAPGFVDHHAHVATDIHNRPLAENFLFQGVTTLLTPVHSGDTPWPLGAYLDRLRTAPNVGYFAGHTSIRRTVMGLANRAPTAAELEQMKAMVEANMRDGALGLSTGLLYVPANYARIEEVIELAKVAARHGGIYVTHMRDEARGLLASVRETIRVADEARIPVQINHHKAAGAGQFGWTRTTIAMIDSARARGLDVKHDVYPYTAGSTHSGVLFPGWALAGGVDSLRARVDDPRIRPRLEAEMLERMRLDWAGDELERIQFRVLPSNPSYNGKTMADLARDRGLAINAVNGVQLAIELQLAGGFSAIYHMMDEADVVRVLQHPFAMIETDGDSVGYGRGFPHPRSYGAFSRVLARYVREQQVLSLEEAIRRMTSLSMEQIGQRERGQVREGMYADLVVFDPERIADLATYQDPHRFSVGMVHIYINGVAVLRDGSLTGATPGRVLRGPARSGS